MTTKMSDADEHMVATALIEIAERHHAERVAAYRPTSYAAMNRNLPRQKAALTRAIRSGNRDKLILTIREAVTLWTQVGVWPDAWGDWQRALDDFRAPGDVGFFPYPAVDIRDLAVGPMAVELAPKVRVVSIDDRLAEGEAQIAAMGPQDRAARRAAQIAGTGPSPRMVQENQAVYYARRTAAKLKAGPKAGGIGGV